MGALEVIGIVIAVIVVEAIVLAALGALFAAISDGLSH